MSEIALSTINLPGIGPARQRRLEEAGIRTAHDLGQLGLEGLSALLGISAPQAQRILDAALAAGPPDSPVDAELPVTVQAEPVEATEPDVAEEEGAPAVEEITEEVVPTPDLAEDHTVEGEPVGDSTEPGPAADDLIARLKNLAAMVAGALAVVGGAEPSRARKRALRRLKKLRRTAEALAEQLSVKAVDQDLAQRLTTELDAIEPRLQWLSARLPTPKRLRRARRWARRARASLSALLS